MHRCDHRCLERTVAVHVTMFPPYFSYTDNLFTTPALRRIGCVEVTGQGAFGRDRPPTNIFAFKCCQTKHLAAVFVSVSRLSLSVCVVPLPALLLPVLMFLDDKATTCRLQSVKLLRGNALWITVTGTPGAALLDLLFSLFLPLLNATQEHLCTYLI